MEERNRIENRAELDKYIFNLQKFYYKNYGKQNTKTVLVAMNFISPEKIFSKDPFMKELVIFKYMFLLFEKFRILKKLKKYPKNKSFSEYVASNLEMIYEEIALIHDFILDYDLSSNIIKSSNDEIWNFVIELYSMIVVYNLSGQETGALIHSKSKLLKRMIPRIIQSNHLFNDEQTFNWFMRFLMDFLIMLRSTKPEASAAFIWCEVFSQDYYAAAKFLGFIDNNEPDEEKLKEGADKVKPLISYANHKWKLQSASAAWLYIPEISENQKRTFVQKFYDLSGVEEPPIPNNLTDEESKMFRFDDLDMLIDTNDYITEDYISNLMKCKPEIMDIIKHTYSFESRLTSKNILNDFHSLFDETTIHLFVAFILYSVFGMSPKGMFKKSDIIKAFAFWDDFVEYIHILIGTNFSDSKKNQIHKELLSHRENINNRTLIYLNNVLDFWEMTLEYHTDEYTPEEHKIIRNKSNKKNFGIIDWIDNDPDRVFYRDLLKLKNLRPYYCFADDEFFISKIITIIDEYILTRAYPNADAISFLIANFLSETYVEYQDVEITYTQLQFLLDLTNDLINAEHQAFINSLPKIHIED